MEDERPMTLRVELSGNFSAEEMDSVLHELAAARSGMAPEVPSRPPENIDLLIQPDPLFIVRTLADGGIRVYLRHRGFGWIPFTLPADQREAFREFLGKEAGRTYTAH